MISGLAKTDAGVKDDVVVCDAGGFGNAGNSAQTGDHVRHQIFVMRLTLVVHQDCRNAGASDDRRHCAVGEASPYVVDQGGAGVDGASGHGRFVGVHADRNADRFADCGERREQAGRFCCCRDWLGPRSGGLCPHVDDVRAVGFHALRQLHRRPWVVGETVAGERVRRQIDDAHDVRAAAPCQRLAAGDRQARVTFGSCLAG